MRNDKTAVFKTRTVFEKKDHGDTGDKWCVALDIGYSAVKIYSPNISAMFPAYAKKETSTYIGKISGNVILYKDLETGECWTVGEDAQSRIDIRDTSESGSVLYGRERYMAPMFKVLVETGIALGSLKLKENGPNGREIFVQTGLPPRYLKSDREMFSSIIEGRHHFSIKLGSGKETEFDITIKPENIDIISQPMGTLFSVMLDSDHKFVRDAESFFGGNVIVFDPGFGTLDIFPIRNHHVETGSLETFDNLGMKRVLEETVGEINSTYKQDISVPTMQRFLETGKFRYVARGKDGMPESKDIDFEEILLRKNKEVCMEALKRLEQVVPLEEYDYLIITGGTSAAWSEIIKDYFAGMSTLKIIRGTENEKMSMCFANVRGYFMYRYNLLTSPPAPEEE